MRIKYLVLVGLLSATAAMAGDIITLTWDQVVSISRKENLELKMLRQDYRNQKLNVWKSLSDFSPTMDYSFQAVNNLELPTMVFMGRSFRVGTKYNFTHNLQLKWPLFLGGARWANYSIQKYGKKSLKELLSGKEEEVALKAIQAYFQIILSSDLVRVNQNALRAAQANYRQVKQFYEAGTASQLDLMRAHTRYLQSLPALTSTRNALKLARENLKFILNFPPQDSLVVLDSLREMDFLGEYAHKSLQALQQLALNSRPDLKSMQFQSKAVGKQKYIAGSGFLPQIFVTAGVQHQAFLQTSKVRWDDYTRAKSASIALQFPIFQGGKRAINLQQAYIQQEKARLQTEQLRRAILLDVKNAYLTFQKAKQNLKSLKQAFKEAQETWRIARLTYRQGLSTQVDVLNAQTALTASETNYRQGVFEFNLAQLKLLKAIGQLHTIWNNEKN